MSMPELDNRAMHLAHLAAIETEGSHATKTAAAIQGYLWAIENKRERPDGLIAYPSLNELREAMKAP